MRKGFTLIELLVVMVIIGILISMALPNYMKAKDRAKETQVQSRLHVIRTALERYAVDNDANYPMWLLGGDWTDWNTTPSSPLYCPNRPQPCGDGDPLLLYGFLNHYPQNVFYRVGLQTGTLLHVFDCPRPCYRRDSNGNCTGRTPESVYCQYTTWFPRVERERCDPSGGSRGSCRKVGGTNSDLMWDVSEGAYGSYTFFPNSMPRVTQTSAIITSRGWQGHPPFGALPSRQEDPIFYRSSNRYMHPLLAGNFFYFPVWKISPAFAAAIGEPILGYHLAGYGATWNRGWDVYDDYGDFVDGAGNHCDSYIEWDGGYGDCKTTLEDNPPPGAYLQHYCYHNGPDGTHDGVIMVLSGGTDVKPMRNIRKPRCQGIR